MEIPRSTADLSARWLTMALRKANVLSAGAVKAFDYAPLGGEA